MAGRISRDRGFPGFIVITLNGVTLDIVTKKAAEEALLPPRELISLGGGKYLYPPSGNRADLYKAAGYEVKKIDFAVPQPWYDHPENRARQQKGDQAVWSYAGKGSFGKPIWDSEMLKRLKTRINQRLRR